MEIHGDYMNVLIIEDDQIQQRVLSDFFTTLNIKSVIKENGSEGMKWVQKNRKKIDLIFSDVQMPVMDGLEFIKEFRIIDTVTPIVLMTANYEVYNSKTVSDVNEYVSKPLNLDLISNIIQKYMINDIDHSNNKMVYK